ncbi:ABC-2 type transporter [Peptostreptococcaceae bacterium oral taxon 113 str. W5053]|nr:ABC-2 type transporter [Peptostreptococcaceae bacterium oral taxon 113 str. W5053]
MYKHWIIFKAALLDIRNEWSWYLILMLVNPLSVLFFLKIIARDSIDFPSYIVGSIVMTFGTGIFLSLGQTFALYKARSSLDYYLVLPLSKNEIILSQIFRNIILSAPSMTMVIIIGIFLYGVRIPISIYFILAIMLTSVSLAGLGTMIGVLSRNVQIASILTQIITPILTYLAPVFVPQSELPLKLRAISYLLPTTYASNSLRAALRGELTIDYLILFLIGIISFLYVVRVLDWRHD